MDQSKQFRKTVFATSASLLLLNLLQAVKAFNETFESLTKFLGSLGIETLHVTTLLLIFAAVGVLAGAFIKHKQLLLQSWRSFALGIGFVAVTAANIVNTELKSPEPQLTEKVGKWCQIIQSKASLSGAIPVSPNIPETQVWTDAQLLKGLLINAQRDPTLIQMAVLVKTFAWIESQRRTNVNGWTYFSDCRTNQPSVTEISAWVLLAQMESLRLTNFWIGAASNEVKELARRDVEEILRRQDASGGFSPVRAKEKQYCRTYSTLMAVHALAEYKTVLTNGESRDHISWTIRNGIDYLMDNYDKTLHSWVPNPQRPLQREPFLGLTAQVIYVLSECDRDDFTPTTRDKFVSACKDLLYSKDVERWEPSRNQRMHDADQHIHSSEYDTCFHLEASTYLAYPWLLAALSRLHHLPDKELQAEKARILRLRASLMSPEMITKGTLFVDGELFYVWAENLIGYGTALADDVPTSKFEILTSRGGLKLGILTVGIVSGVLSVLGGSKRKPNHEEEETDGGDEPEAPAPTMASPPTSRPNISDPSDEDTSPGV
jgi:hypothetical protein